MQVRIGVQLVPKELVVETTQSADEVEQALAAALESDTKLSDTKLPDTKLFVMKDSRGGRIVIPAKHVGYLEITEDEGRQVGFGTL